MATYYCDLDGTFADKSGEDNTGNQALSPAGLYCIANGIGSATAPVAGDTVYVKGTGEYTRLVVISIGDEDKTSWDFGDSVRNNTGSGDDWTGTLLKVNFEDYGGGLVFGSIVVWLDEGYDYNDVDFEDDVENVTKSDTAGGTNKSSTFTSFTNNGSVSSRIKIIGVNSSWTEDGTYAVLDGLTTSYAAGNGMIFNNAKSYYTFRNFEVKNSSDTGLRATGTGIIFENCYAHNNTSAGLSQAGDATYIIRCKSDGNGRGVATGMQNIYYSMIINNTGQGCNGLRTSALVYGCVFANNGAEGIDFAGDYSNIINCVFDNNTEDGIEAGNTNTTILNSRFTNNGEYGIFSSSSKNTWYAGCYFEDNTSGNCLDCNEFENLDNEADQGDTNEGYVDPDNEDYNLRSDATYRSEEVILPGS